MAEYKLGTDDPKITFDTGAGVYRCHIPEKFMELCKNIFMHFWGHFSVYAGRNAAAHLMYYFRKSGGDFKIELHRLVEEVKSAKELYNSEVKQAKQFVMTLGQGTYKITSGKASNFRNSNYNLNLPGDKNWFYAIGGYSSWGKGVATVKGDKKNPSYELEFVYNVRDRYNWDPGKSVAFLQGPCKLLNEFRKKHLKSLGTLGYTVNSVLDTRLHKGVVIKHVKDKQDESAKGIVIFDQCFRVYDNFMGEFHRQGLAKEFGIYGSIKTTDKWK